MGALRRFNAGIKAPQPKAATSTRWANAIVGRSCGTISPFIRSAPFGKSIHQSRFTVVVLLFAWENHIAALSFGAT